jgi:hypothetical protein
MLLADIAIQTEINHNHPQPGSVSLDKKFGLLEGPHLTVY